MYIVFIFSMLFVFTALSRLCRKSNLDKKIEDEEQMVFIKNWRETNDL